LDWQYERVTPRARGRVGVVVWVAGKRRCVDPLRRTALPATRMFDIHACSGECGILAENPGHRHRCLFSYFDRQEFSQTSLICPA